MASQVQLSPAHCVLLAAHYAAESNIDAVRTLSLARPDAFAPDLLLRILLTFLPESTEPSAYNLYAQEVASRLYLQQRVKIEIDTAPVKDLSDSQAQKRARKLDLIPLAHATCPADELDNLTLFLIHRAYRIDAETGLLNLIPQLVDPFLDQSEFLRTWFISTILPLLRLDYEYYPNVGATTSLEKFSALYGAAGVDILVGKSQGQKDAHEIESGNIARDLKGVVGPWMYGESQRKRRRLLDSARRSSVGGLPHDQKLTASEAAPGAPSDHHDWEHVYAWMVRTAAHRFDLVSSAVDSWDGPSDVDLGGYEDPDYRGALDEDVRKRLERRYSQAAFACVYSAESNSRQTVEAAHGVLVRLASFLQFEPPPDLATSVEMLPSIEGHASILSETSSSILQPDTLLKEDHPLTVPKMETFALLQIFVYSAYLLADIGFPISLSNLAKFRFHADEDDQMQMVSKILKGLVNNPKTDEEKWKSVRNKLIWLWNWGMDPGEEHALNGPGAFGKIGRFSLEKEILSSLIAAGQFSLAIEVYLPVADGRRDHLQDDDIEDCVLGQVMQHYDNASNGNATRGGMKKALDIMTAFQPHFSDSPAFLSTESLLAATHSLSFYSLTLQHGVPFRPVNIRISDDPVSLIEKVLDQNPRSYSKLDDLITIGQNLVSARTLEREGPMLEESMIEMQERKRLASRRVIGMAIQAALAEDDFETAYSFVVNRLNSSFDPTATKSTLGRSSRGSIHAATAFNRPKDDVSWRAAYLAGKHRSPNSSLSSSHASVTGSPALRRLDQRMELLSQALLLAPPSAVPEVLTAWRRCEEEMTALLAQETEEEERFNDHADRRAPGAFPQTAAVQPRREVGRGAAEESPMGLFDVARGAAAAFSRSAFPLRAGGGSGAGGGEESGRSSMDASRNLSVAGSDAGSIGGAGSGDEGGRVRKRDMVASAVTGGLASGIGWVLGATPVADQQRGDK